MSQVDNILPDHIKSSLSEAEVDSDGEINMERVPFAKNTIRMDLKQIDKNLKLMNSQNKENYNESTDENQNRSITPANETEHPGQPLTPTANLKVLFNAVSPELRYRDEQTKDSSNEDNTILTNQPDYQFETVIELSSSQDMDADLKKYGLSRKEKSLGLLCQKFLQKYPEYPKASERLEICLDEVAKELQVERRRIYDIVNVLESVEIVSRVAKNKYAWHGKSNLCTTLAKLKALGDNEGFGEQIQKLKEYEFTRDLEEQLGKYDPQCKPPEPDFSMFGDSSLFNQAALRKDKSLGIMSQKFLMLFLVSKPRTVNLDLSAKLLIGDANIDRTENAKFKTKIRRLYDIANILTSLNLIRKVHVTEIRGRKPAFKYVGPEIDKCDSVQNLSCCSDGCHRPSSRHSMLDCIQNENVSKIMSSYKNVKPVSKVITQTRESDDGPVNGKFVRHSSFEQLCAVAAVETDRMNASAPSSPAKSQSTDDETSEKKVVPNHLVSVQSSDGVIRGHIKVLDKGVESTITNKLPTKGFVRKKVPGKTTEQSDNLGKAVTKVQGAEAIIIKSSHKPSGNGKQPTVIPLTKEQIDAVLRSLKVPVPVSKENIDATTQSSPVEEVDVETDCLVQVADMQEINEKTPVVNVNTADVCGIKRPASPSDSIPLEKRVKLEFSSPVSLANKSPPLLTESLLARFKRKTSDAKPSPQRALHLTPEFVNPSQTITMAPSGDAPKLLSPVIAQVENLESSKAKKIEIIINESSSTGQPTVLKTLTISSPTSRPQVKPQTSTVQFVNTSPTVVHLPVISLQGSTQPKLAQQIALPVQYVQDTKGQLVQITGQSHLPNITTINSGTDQVITYLPASQNSFALSNVQLVQSHQGKISNAATTLFRPVATKATLSPNPTSQIVPPQQPKSSPTALLNKTPGGFIPVAGTMTSHNGPKITITSPNSCLGDVFVTQNFPDVGALS